MHTKEDFDRLIDLKNQSIDLHSPEALAIKERIFESDYNDKIKNTEKYTIHMWVGECVKILEKLGLKRIDDSCSFEPIEDKNIFEAAQFIFGNGLNTMLYHGKDQYILFVDTSKFSQR